MKVGMNFEGTGFQVIADQSFALRSKPDRVVGVFGDVGDVAVVSQIGDSNERIAEDIVI